MSAAYADVRALWEPKLAEARADSAANRKAVLVFPDLAARLTERPIGYERPEQWTGYLPPPTYNGARNDSDRRAALAELITEALIRQEKAA